MKKKNKLLLKVQSYFAVVSTLLLLFSCANGYNDEWSFSSSVTNTQLKSPEEIEITTKTNEKGEDLLQIEWSVVHGAGGYQFTLYNIDDPESPTPVGEENEVIDGCTVSRIVQEDTRYKISILTLGNDKYNNKGAEQPSILEHSTLVPTIATIPDGSDIAEFFNQNPIKQSKEEQAYELIAGGNYTINSELKFGLNWITLRGDKINRANVVYGIDGRISTMGGLKIKFINFDCTNLNSGSSNSSFLLLDSNPDESIKGKGDYYIIEKDIAIQSCNIKGINKHLLYDNNKKYCSKTFRIQDCIISLNSTNEIIFPRGGFINDLTLMNNTIYSPEGVSCKYFIQYNNSGRPNRAGFVNGSINFYNNTLYGVAKTNQMANYSGMRSNSVTLRLTKNLFVDCGNKEVVRRLSGGNRNMVRVIANNCYWYEGGFKDNEEMGDGTGDNAEANGSPSSGFYEDANFVGPINNINPIDVVFVPTGTEILKRGVGDQRWLPLNDINN